MIVAGGPMAAMVAMYMYHLTITIFGGHPLYTIYFN